MNTRSRKSSTVKRDSGRHSSRSQSAKRAPAPTTAPGNISAASVSKSCRRTLSTSAKKAEGSEKKNLSERVQEAGCRVIELPGYAEQAKLLCSLLQSTVKHIESNSILICGPRGCGKSTFLEQCLKSECNPHKTDIMYFNGFMDTEATKLFQYMRLATETENRSTTALMDSLICKCGTAGSTMILVLDEFDRFCKHTDQTFLYNIFDLSQKCRQLFIAGMTTRLDCLELLEKRVKSRMNHTVINLSSPFADVQGYLRAASDIAGPIRGKKGKLMPDDRLRRQFSKNPSLRDLKHLIIEAIGEDENVCQPSTSSSIVTDMTSLSNMEFLILTVAHTYCLNSGLDVFPCDSMLKEISKFAGRTRLSRELAFKLIDNLISYGFLKKPSSRDNHFLNDWSMLQLNFGTDDLKQAFNEMRTSLPAHLQVLVNIR